MNKFFGVYLLGVLVLVVLAISVMGCSERDKRLSALRQEAGDLGQQAQQHSDRAEALERQLMALRLAHAELQDRARERVAEFRERRQDYTEARASLPSDQESPILHACDQALSACTSALIAEQARCAQAEAMHALSEERSEALQRSYVLRTGQVTTTEQIAVLAARQAKREGISLWGGIEAWPVVEPFAEVRLTWRAAEVYGVGRASGGFGAGVRMRLW